MTTRDDLRRQMRIVRKGLAGSAAQAARALAGHVAALPVESVSGLVVTVYRAAGSEIDPAPLVAALRSRGAHIALPVVIARETPLTFRIWTDGEALLPDAAGIPAPPPEAQDVRPGLILAPLLAFDRRGGRLGQGGGYYDRTLRALRHSGPLIAVGLAFAAQEVAEVPMAPHDEPLDGVLTEDGYRARSS